MKVNTTFTNCFKAPNENTEQHQDYKTRPFLQKTIKICTGLLTID
jgi:hypothetical protein